MNANPQDKVNILLVDDQPAKLLSYQVILGELGENLITASSAREALACLLKTEVAIVLMDVCMPELDGFELAAMLREHPRFEKVAIIFISAIHMTDLDRVKGYEHGAVDYIPVPVVPEILRAKVRAFTDLYRKTRQLERLNLELERRVAERTAELEASNARLLESEARLSQLNSDLERRVEERTQQILQLQKTEALGQLTGGVAHDFNNLLGAILSNLEVLRPRLTGDPKGQTMVDCAIQGAERGAALTRRLLAFARKQELRPEPVDVPELVRGMADMLQRSIGPQVQIETWFALPLDRALIDPHQLELAILNLAVNGRDAMPDGGVLTIGASDQTVGPDHPSGLRPGRYVRVTVADTGQGMDAKTLNRATEPFFTTKGIGKGTGLGLSMVQGLAAQSGGAMIIDSAPGQGTTVALWLPRTVSGQEPAALPETAAPRPEALPCTILLVDDDALVRMSLATALENLGHTVVEAYSGEYALNILRSGRPIDLVITDQAMPSMTGLQLIRELRRSGLTMPTLLASGYAEFPPEAQGIRRLGKPTSQSALAKAIGEVMAEVNQARAAEEKVVPLRR